MKEPISKICVWLTFLLTLVLTVCLFNFAELTILKRLAKNWIFLISIGILIICTLLMVHRAHADKTRIMEWQLLLPFLGSSGVIIWIFIAQFKIIPKPGILFRTTVPEYEAFVSYIFAGLGVILTFIAFFIQYLANRQHAQRLDEAQEDNRRARFENTFFDALRSYQSIVQAQNMKGIGTGPEVFKYMYWEYIALKHLIGKYLKEIPETSQNHIVFSIFFLGITLNGTNDKIKNYLELMGCEDQTRKDILERIYKIQKTDPIGDSKTMKDLINNDDFKYIVDFAQNSLWNKEKVMWYDGHKHRLLHYFRMRNYICIILNTDEYTRQNSAHRDKYETYFNALITEYEQRIFDNFITWRDYSYNNVDFWKIFELKKSDYEMCK